MASLNFKSLFHLTSDMTEENKNLDEVIALVQENDPDRFRMALLMPEDIRPAILSVLAFNQEIAKTREVVTETQIGHIRLQWWRDRLTEIYKGEKGGWQHHFILSHLAKAIVTYDLPQDDFELLIYAREFDLEDIPPESLDGLIKYADFTTSPLNRLLLRIERSELDPQKIADISVGYALCGLIRAIPSHLADNRILIPETLIKKNDVTYSDLLKGKKQENMTQIVEYLRLEAQKRLNYPQSCSKIINMTQETAVTYSKRIKKAKNNPFHPSLKHAGIFLPIKLYWRYK